MARGKATDIRVLEVLVTFEAVSFRAPLKFGGRVVDHTYLINARANVETRNGQKASGYGSMPVGNVWAWPSAQIDPADSEKAMMAYAEKFGELFGSYPEFAHPLEIQYNVGAEFQHQAQKVSDRLELPEPLPPLAQLVATSPIDAALHDAYGRAHKKNSFQLLSSEYCNEDLSYFLDDNFSGEYLDRYCSADPVPSLPLYHLVGALDPLTDTDVTDRPDDGLPVTLPEWIAADELTHFKIKLAGDNLDWDVQRVLSIEAVTGEAQKQRGCTAWFYSCDFNEKCDSADYVIEFLNRIKDQSAAAYDRIQYIEQPTSRDLEAASAAKMHEVAKLKPVVIDEALVDYEALLKCRELGYSGVALKACKGQTESLFAAAAAQKFDMFLCVQDLTCPGASFLHSCSLAAHVPGIAAVEGNARQYCPGPNAKWAPRYPEVFRISGGAVNTSRLNGHGLGFHLSESLTGLSMEESVEPPQVQERIVKRPRTEL
ncbi:MAG: mandelate racemase/muconate lactonizing enzyme family protein [Fuerstiella sp.]